MNYEFNLLHHVDVVAKRVGAAAAAAHEGDNNTPSGPTGPGVKNEKVNLENVYLYLTFILNHKLNVRENKNFPYQTEIGKSYFHTEV